MQQSRDEIQARFPQDAILAPGAIPLPFDPLPEPQVPRRRFRTLFLSDFHLGTVGCKSAPLLDFLQRHEADELYLVGDIFDNWRPLGGHWSEEHETILKLLLGRARAGHRIRYIPGNHDDFFRRFLGNYFEEVEIARDAWHVTATGERLLVTHGDVCDKFAHRLPWLSKAGSWFEAFVRRVDWVLNKGRRGLGLEPWTWIEDGISSVNGMIRARDRFEERLSDLALARQADGIVCGHFHQPALHNDFGVIYANCGDWVENCSALIEHHDGTLELVHWHDASMPEIGADPADEGEFGLAG